MGFQTAQMGSQSEALLFGPQKSALFEDFGKPFSADAESGRDLLRRLTGQVSLDRIVHVDVRSFSGHVYNLHTIGNWYLANGIIAHNCAACIALHGTIHRLDERMASHPNCRCTAVPHLKGEPVPIASGVDWFRDQKAA